ncbi:hypothetical protein VR46_10350 [Streptomyces sp. NRRL S-444]|nr:hypothetical protein VR46_10350 [Streptomyces sp. NRRL S-444]
MLPTHDHDEEEESQGEQRHEGPDDEGTLEAEAFAALDDDVARVGRIIGDQDGVAVVEWLAPGWGTGQAISITLSSSVTNCSNGVGSSPGGTGPPLYQGRHPQVDTPWQRAPA